MGYERAMYFKSDSKPVDLSHFGMSGGITGLDKLRYSDYFNYLYFHNHNNVFDIILISWSILIFLCSDDGESKKTVTDSRGRKIKVATTDTFHKVSFRGI